TQDSADPVDHVFTNYESDGNATCTKNGTKTAECDFGCGTTDTIEDEDSSTGHSFTEYESDNNATCIKDGTKTATCDNGCGTTDTIDDEGSANGHDFTDYVSDGNATCTEDGTKTANCNNGCGETDTIDDEGSALGHDFADYISDNNATCTEDGTKTAQCSRGCGEKDTATDEGSALGHDFDWVITLMPTEEEEGLKENLCKRGCGAKDGEEVIAKLVVDDNGSVADLPTGHDYDLEIAVKESDSLYNIAGITKGYKVELFVVDGDNRIEYDNSKTVTLMLVIPEGMEDNFALYCRHGDILETVDPASYTVSGRSVTIRTTLPNEYVFNAPAPEEPSAGIPWWVWLIVGIGVVVVIILIIVIALVAKNKKNNNGGTPVDNGEVIQRLDSQDQMLNEILNRGDDGGFNTPVELDENGNVIFK
ncbi:MAG: hypothetical protein K2O67_03395, partial [Clostridia bacterium]|nr:hypothetical protein [Clostridia bacterium]